MKIIIKTLREFPADLACVLANQIVNDEYEHCIYTWDYEPKVHASKVINKNGTVIIGFWEEKKGD